MSRWLLRRSLQALVTFTLAVLLLFVLLRVAPGDPLSRLTEERAVSERELAQLRARFGLNQPLGAQLRAFLSGVTRGDLGVSIGHYPEPVTSLIAARLPATLLLGGAVLLLNFTVGAWLGVRQAVRRGSGFDRWLTRLALAAYATPSFWLGMVLVAFVSIRWHLLPAAQMSDPLLAADAGPVTKGLDVLRHLVLPVLTLSLTSIALPLRHQRAAMLASFRLDFVTAARARGITERRVRWRHAWRTTLVPMLTLLGLWLPILVSGSVFVEAVFNWPGLGSLAAEAIGSRDYPVLMGTAMLVSGVVVLAGLLTDLGYALLDPRVRPA
ncbi:MAG TPA: ABC transporter permease [Gemmatimonadales bacterium]|nr:ABC transporter permease [Gemmatimonadales bacterium]